MKKSYDEILTYMKTDYYENVNKIFKFLLFMLTANAHLLILLNPYFQILQKDGAVSILSAQFSGIIAHYKS